MASPSAKPASPASFQGYPGLLDEYYAYETLSITVNGASLSVCSLLTGAVLVGIYQLLTARSGEERPIVRALLILLGLVVVLQNAFELYSHWLQCKAAVRGTPTLETIVSWAVVPIGSLACLTGVMVQAFFASIVYRTLARRMLRTLWVGFCFSAGAATLITGLAHAVVMDRLFRRPLYDYDSGASSDSDVNKRALQLRSFFLGWLLIAAAYDALLSGILISNFVRSIQSNGSPHAKSILKSFTISTLETFSLTAFTSAIAAITIIVPKHGDLIWLAKTGFVAHTLTKLLTRFYAMSLVYTLHRRRVTREKFIHNRHVGNVKSISVHRGSSTESSVSHQGGLTTGLHRFRQESGDSDPISPRPPRLGLSAAELGYSGTTETVNRLM